MAGRSNAKPVELLAEQLLPGDRFVRNGKTWFAVYVACTPGLPVTVRARAMEGTTILSTQTEMQVAADEIVMLR